MAGFLNQLKADLNPFDGPAKPKTPSGPSAAQVAKFNSNLSNLNSGIANNGLPSGYSAAAISPSNPDGKVTAGYDYSGAIAAANAAAEAAQQNYLATQAQLAAQPKIYTYNSTAAYAAAQKQATSKENAVYQDKLNQYLQQEALGKTQQTRQEQEAEQGFATTLANQLADNTTNRTRTSQDQTTQTGDVNNNETNYQADSGTAFDQARQALLGNVANSGLTTSGLGRGQEATSIAQRNQNDNEQTQQFNAQRRDINTTAQRTFDDLTTSDTRSTSAAATNTTQAKESLQDYIDNAKLAEQGERINESAAEQGDIAQTSQQLYQQGVQKFIAGLVGSGARAQDISATAQLYGA